MRQRRSRGSAKAFYLDREEALARLREAAREAPDTFPEAEEVLLFGALARGTHTGLSDVDVAVVLRDAPGEDDVVERARPFHAFFFRRLGVSVDTIVFRENERERMASSLEGAIVLARRAAGS